MKSSPSYKTSPPTIDPVSIMHHMYTTVLLVNNDFKICWLNSQAEQLFSVSDKRLMHQSIFPILLPVQPVTNTAAHSNQAGEKQRQLDIEQNEDLDKLKQQFCHAQEYQQPFLDYNQQITGTIQPLLVDYSVTPITEGGKPFFVIELWQKNSQSRIDRDQRQKEEMEVARQMLRSVAHEVKNPLAGIRGAAQLLVRQLTPKDEKKSKKQKSSEKSNNNTVAKVDDQNNKPIDNAYKPGQPKALVRIDSYKVNTYAGIVISETDRLTNLIGQLLGSNQLPTWQAINIHEPLEHVLMLTQAQQPKVRINRDYDLSLPKLVADKDQLIQVFLNLINNAYDAMLEQNTDDNYVPTLTVTTRIQFQHNIGVVHHRQVLKVCVQDNGRGIAAELIGRIFYPLVTGRASGTGLGLSLVQDIIDRHQGMIQVDSVPGNTAFCIYLPFEQSKSE